MAALRPAASIGFNRRFARALPTASMRDPLRITAIFDAPEGDWDPTRPPVDPLLDLGCHLVDLSLWLTGSQAERVRSLPGTRGRARFEVELAHGTRLYAECGAAEAYRELLQVRDAGGRVLTWSWPETGPRQIAAWLQRRAHGLPASWCDQLEAFVASLQGARGSRLASAGEAVGVMAALDAVRASAERGGGWVRTETEARSSAGASAG